MFVFYLFFFWGGDDQKTAWSTSFWQLDCWFLGVDKVSWKFSEQLVLVEGKKSGSLSIFKSFKMIESWSNYSDLTRPHSKWW